MFSLNDQTALWHPHRILDNTPLRAEHRAEKASSDPGQEMLEKKKPIEKEDLLEKEVLPFSLDNPPTADHPICCWNICASITGKKTPRPAFAADAAAKPRIERMPAQALPSTAFFSSGPASASLPAPNSAGADLRAAACGPQAPRPYQHLSRRLLIEPVSPNEYLVFNPLSGAVDLFSRKEWAAMERLQRGQTVLLAPAQECLLRERGYLFDSLAEEEECLEKSVHEAWERMQHRQPEAYTVCPTLACNLACAYCFEGDSLQDKPQGVMTDRQVEEMFAAIAEIRRGAAQEGHQAPAAPWICLFGGEPLLPSTKRCVSQILRRAAENGFLVGATTNGVNITRYADLLREYADILTTFQITLDGPQAVHDSRRHRLGGQGTFNEIVQGIDLLLSLGIDVDVRVNLDATNLAALPELVDFIFEKGWEAKSGFQLALAPVTQHGTGESKTGGDKTRGLKTGGLKTHGCSEKSANVLSEMELTQTVLALLETQPRLAEICHLGFLRHLAHLVSVLEPASQERSASASQESTGAGSRRPGSRRAGPRYWYCEASTDKQFVFTPEGLIYRCTESVGKPQHAIGRFVPELDIWQEESKQWTGRTILSHPQCRSCAISTLCGGGCHFAARERHSTSHRGDKSAARTLENTLLQIALPRPLSKAGSPPNRADQPNPEATAFPDSHDGRPVFRAIRADGGSPAASSQRTESFRTEPFRTEPFCNAAEETVRTYLRHIGKHLIAQRSSRMTPK